MSPTTDVKELIDSLREGGVYSLGTRLVAAVRISNRTGCTHALCSVIDMKLPGAERGRLAVEGKVDVIREDTRLALDATEAVKLFLSESGEIENLYAGWDKEHQGRTVFDLIDTGLTAIRPLNFSVISAGARAHPQIENVWPYCLNEFEVYSLDGTEYAVLPAPQKARFRQIQIRYVLAPIIKVDGETRIDYSQQPFLYVLGDESILSTRLEDAGKYDRFNVKMLTHLNIKVRRRSESEVTAVRLRLMGGAERVRNASAEALSVVEDLQNVPDRGVRRLTEEIKAHALKGLELARRLETARGEIEMY